LQDFHFHYFAFIDYFRHFSHFADRPFHFFHRFLSRFDIGFAAISPLSPPRTATFSMPLMITLSFSPLRCFDFAFFRRHAAAIAADYAFRFLRLSFRCRHYFIFAFSLFSLSPPLIYFRFAAVSAAAIADAVFAD
jgi:hypothetical protein